MNSLRVFALVALVGAAQVVTAQVPQMLHYQGRIVTGAANFEGAGLFKFALVQTNLSGTVTLWSNNGSSVGGAEPSAAVNIPVVRGLYSVLLGDTSLPNMQPVTPSVFSGTDVRLRVWFNDGASGFQLITPDQRITSVGYAMVAGNVPDGAITAAKFAPNALTEGLGDGTLPISKIAGGSPGQVLTIGADGHPAWALPQALSELLGQNYSMLVPNVLDNTMALEIDGLQPRPFQSVIINGPGYEIQRIENYPIDHPGPNMEFPFVFECSGSATNSLTNWYRSCQTNDDFRTISVILLNLAGLEQNRWNLFEMKLASMTTGEDGRTRYTCQHRYTGDNQVMYELDGTQGANEESRNPSTENEKVEISDILIGSYPGIEVNTMSRTITLTMNYNEIGRVPLWAMNTAEGVTDILKDIGIYPVDAAGTEILGGYNYHNCFPISFQHVSGFNQYEKTKMRVVIAYSNRNLR